MKTRTALIVVGITAALFALGLLAVILVGRSLQSLRARVNSEVERQTFVARWRPPANRDATNLLPARVLHHAGTNFTPTVHWAGFGLEHPGWSATYLAAAQAPIQVSVLAPETIASSNVFARARAWYDTTQGNKTFLQFNDRIRLSTVQPPRSIEIWSLQGWTFVFSSVTDPGTDFIRTCLELVSTPATDQP